MLIKPLKQNAKPLPPLGPPETREEWEQQVFANADYFKVSRKAGTGKFETKTFTSFKEALRNAVYVEGNRMYRDATAMVYVVAKDERSFCVPPKAWADYLKLWEKRNG